MHGGFRVRLAIAVNQSCSHQGTDLSFERPCIAAFGPSRGFLSWIPPDRAMPSPAVIERMPLPLSASRVKPISESKIAITSGQGFGLVLRFSSFVFLPFVVAILPVTVVSVRPAVLCWLLPTAA